MFVQTLTSPQKSTSTPTTLEKIGLRGRLLIWISAIVSFSILGYLILVVAHQFLAPPAAQRLTLVQDIPLPSGLAKNAQQAHSLAPGVELQFDNFDLQAYDTASHRLFIAHTGPNPDDMRLNHIPFDPRYDGNVVVFDTLQNKVIGRIATPQVTGIVDATDLRKIFAADSTDNIIYDINVDTMEIEGQIQLPDNDSPDAIGYDPVDHRIFVSDKGSPVNPLKSGNIDPKNQNVAVIDAVDDELLGLVNLGTLPLFGGEQAPVSQPGNFPTYGRAVGHNDYDLEYEYVTAQVLPNADDPNAYILPPPHTAEFIAINAVTMSIDMRIVLPAYCSTPHGMTIDKEQHIAFVACTDFDSQTKLFENLLRVDLRTMAVIPTDPNTMRLASGPDVVRIDYALHLLFVASFNGITIFDEKAGQFHRLGLAFIGKRTHTIAINEQTQEMYFPIFAGGLPVLRITRYNPNGA